MAQQFPQRLGRMAVKRSMGSPLSDASHAKRIDRQQPLDDAAGGVVPE